MKNGILWKPSFSVIKRFLIFTKSNEKIQNKKQGIFYVLDSPSWVNIIPVTKDGNIVLIKQYRHGSNSITIEIPGGLVEKAEQSRNAAERECTEETGYTSSDPAILLGENLPNPAFLNNKCKSFLWLNCTRTTNQIWMRTKT